MIRNRLAASLLSLSVLMLAAVVPARADSANLLGVFKNWSAYSTGSGGNLTCYAMSEPRASQPRNARRNAIYLMVSDWPGRKVRGEPQIVPGYEYKPGAAVSLGIGGEKFTFFSRNDGKSGVAWLQNLNESQRLMSALSGGVSAVAIGTSARGTRTVDTYSLAGFADALARIHASCNM